MPCLYKRLEFTEHLRRGWKGWKMITILSNNSAERLGKHHQFNVFLLVFVFHCSGNPVLRAVGLSNDIVYYLLTYKSSRDEMPYSLERFFIIAVPKKV